MIDLFGGCGDVVDAFVLDPSREMCYKYGFVRFSNMGDALKAVSEIHQWTMKGSKIVVQLAKDTRLQSGKDFIDRKMTVQKAVGTPSDLKHKTSHLEGLKNFGRFKEACGAINEEMNFSTGGSVNIEKLSEDIREEPCSRAPACSSKLYDADSSLEDIRDRLLTRKCDKSCTSDKQAEEFKRSLKKIVANITTFLEREKKESVSRNLNRQDSMGYSSQFSDSDSDQFSPKCTNFSKFSSQSEMEQKSSCHEPCEPGFGSACPGKHTDPYAVPVSSEDENGSCVQDQGASFYMGNESELSSGYCEDSEPSKESTWNKEAGKLTEQSSIMHEIYQKIIGRGRGINRSNLRSLSSSPLLSVSSSSISSSSTSSSTTSSSPHGRTRPLLLSHLGAPTTPLSGVHDRASHKSSEPAGD